jgi:hypothetical protein
VVQEGTRIRTDFHGSGCTKHVSSEGPASRGMLSYRTDFAWRTTSARRIAQFKASVRNPEESVTTSQDGLRIETHRSNNMIFQMRPLYIPYFYKEAITSPLMSVGIYTRILLLWLRIVMSTNIDIEYKYGEIK